MRFLSRCSVIAYPLFFFSLLILKLPLFFCFFATSYQLTLVNTASTLSYFL